MAPRARERFRPWSGLVWWLAILTGLKTLASAGVMTDLLNTTAVRLILAIIAAVDAATTVVVGVNRPHRKRPLPPGGIG